MKNFKKMKKSELVELLEGLYCSEKTSMFNSSDVAKVLRKHIGIKNMQEHFVAMYLNGAKEIIETKTLFIGTLNRTTVHPREVFAYALEYRAASIIVGHNHPSGNLEPSVDDILMTLKLKEAGEIMGIELLDHVIITDMGYYSFQGMGKI